MNFDEDEAGGQMLRPSNSFADYLLTEIRILNESPAYMQSMTDLRSSRQGPNTSGLRLNKELKLDKESDLCTTEMELYPKELNVLESDINLDDGTTTRYTAMATYRDGKEKIEIDGSKIDVALSNDFGSDLEEQSL